jgi:hypothetical protein
MNSGLLRGVAKRLRSGRSNEEKRLKPGVLSRRKARTQRH